MKYEAVHKCEHRETVQLVGPHRERERKLAWLAQQLCSACVQAERVKVAQRLGDMQAQKGLPALVGSERQVTWAIQIRQDFVLACEDLDRKFRNAANQPSAPIAGQMLVELGEISSKWTQERFAQAWIDNRQKLSRDGLYSEFLAKYEACRQLNPPVST